MSLTAKNIAMAAIRERLNQRVKCCADCRELKPRGEFQLRSFGRGLGLASFCHQCASARRQRASKHRREYMDNKRREAGAKAVPARSGRTERNSGNPSSYRMPDDSVQDYVSHAMVYRDNVKLMKLAISTAPQWMLPEIKRGIREAMAA
jgi:hypothetical protein